MNSISTLYYTCVLISMCQYPMPAYGLESYLKNPEKRRARNCESYMKDLEKSRADSAA